MQMPVLRSLRTVVRPANLDDALPVGRLWALAFADKFGPAFGDVPEHNAALLADLHRLGEGRMLRATLVAEAEGEVIGFLLAHPGHEGFADFPLIEGGAHDDPSPGIAGIPSGCARVRVNGRR
jgi:hypothetical protein